MSKRSEIVCTFRHIAVVFVTHAKTNEFCEIGKLGCQFEHDMCLFDHVAEKAR